MSDVPLHKLSGMKAKDNGDGTFTLYVIAEGLAVSDLQIGAVELKNDSDDTRAKVGAGAAANALRVVNATDDPGVASLASILAKLIAAPATEAKQDTLIAKDFATETSLAAVLAKLIAAPATEAKQDAIATKLDSIITALTTANGHLAALEAGLPYHV